MSGLGDLFARYPGRFPGRTLLAALLLCALAVVAGRGLGIDADLVSLLPEGSPAAEDYRVFLERFGGFEKVFIVITAPEGDSLDQRGARAQKTARRLEELLAASPVVASVRSGLQAEDEDFIFRYGLPRALLLLPEDRWREAVAERAAPEAVAERVARMRRTLATPAGSFEAPLLKADPLGFAQDLPALAGGPSGLPMDPLTSTFLSDSGDASLVILTPAQSEIDAAGGRALLAELEAAFEQVRGEIEGPVEIHALGGPLYAAQDEALLRTDLRRTLTGSILGCAAVLVLAFEGVLLPLVCLLALGFALVWTGGLVALVVGPVTGVSVGFASVIVGLGIDYGIHGATRFRQQVLGGQERRGALAETFRHAGPGILTSALTTAGAFGVLALAHFRPLRELGTVVAVGMLAVLLATATAGAALLVVLPPPRRRPGPPWRWLGHWVRWSTALGERHARTVLVVAVGLTAVAAVGLGRLGLDPDLSALRPVDHPALEGERLLVDRFAVGLDTANVVIPGATRGEALERAAAVTALIRRMAPPGVSVTSPADWLPGEERTARRLEALAQGPEGELLARAAEQAQEELRAVGLNPRAFRSGLDALAAMAAGRDPDAPPAEAWPEWLDQLVREDSDGAWVALSLRLPSGTWNQGPPAELLEPMRAAAPGLAFASAVAMGPELRSLAARDLRNLAGWALALVALVVLVSFRGRVSSAVLAMVPVSLASVWTLGLWALAGGALDLVSLAVVPVMLGIGIDDGLHAVHGSREEGLTASVRGAGRAMTLTTLTTVVGFGSLLLSRVPGLRNGGSLVALGVLASLLATLLLLPALAALRSPRRSG
ncbi:MAG: MMPL family transporter [Acidobacteriota bacterium]|nr:MMPL family transporter [Acidobacteriota bacterium]